jgi:hypothetical protein
MPNWIDKKIPWSDRKNSDLTPKIWAQLQKTISVCVISFNHVKAWHDYTRPRNDDPKLAHWLGNKKAEKYAEDGIK